MIDFPSDQSLVDFGVPMYQAIFCELLLVKEPEMLEKKSKSMLQWFREMRLIILLTEILLLEEYILFTKNA